MRSQQLPGFAGDSYWGGTHLPAVAAQAWAAVVLLSARAVSTLQQRAPENRAFLQASRPVAFPWLRLKHQVQNKGPVKWTISVSCTYLRACRPQRLHPWWWQSFHATKLARLTNNERSIVMSRSTRCNIALLQKTWLYCRFWPEIFMVRHMPHQLLLRVQQVFTSVQMMVSNEVSWAGSDSADPSFSSKASLESPARIALSLAYLNIYGLGSIPVTMRPSACKYKQSPGAPKRF